MHSLVFVALAVVTLALCSAFPNAATNPEKGVYLDGLPLNIPGHWGERIPMSDIEKDKLPEDTGHMRRTYYRNGVVNEGVRNFTSLNATIILAGTDQRSLHRPHVCLQAAGWTTLPEKVITVETKGGPLEVMDLPLKMERERSDGTKITIRSHYVYWWVGKDVSTPYYSKRILISTMNNLLHNVNDRWAYPSVMVNVVGTNPENLLEVTPEDDERALQRALSFIRDYAPEFQRSLGANGDDS